MQRGIHQARSRFRSDDVGQRCCAGRGRGKRYKSDAGVCCWLHPLSNRAENSSVTPHITLSRYLCPSKKFLTRLISTFVEGSGLLFLGGDRIPPSPLPPVRRELVDLLTYFANQIFLPHSETTSGNFGDGDLNV